MTQESSPESETQAPDVVASGARRAWYLDWKVLLGIAITVVALWFALRDVPLGQIFDAIAGANLVLLIGGSVPAYFGAIWFRALRWRQITDSIAPMPRSTVFRAIAIGFMANNLIPLRVGEFVRSWYLARETGTRVSAVFGTVVLERVIDVACVVMLAGFSVALLGDRYGDGGILADGAVLLAPVGLLPLLAILALRFMPEPLLAILLWFCSPLPDRVATRIEGLAREFIAGLGAVRGGAHLAWIAIHSILVWMLFSTIPVTVGLAAFGIEFRDFWELVVASWALLAGVGVAVALPSAPGFLGTYQLPFKAILGEMGVAPADALAVGLVVWFFFWATLTAMGLAVLRMRGTSLGELTAQAGKDPTPDRR